MHGPVIALEGLRSMKIHDRFTLVSLVSFLALSAFMCHNSSLRLYSLRKQTVFMPDCELRAVGVTQANVGHASLRLLQRLNLPFTAPAWGSFVGEHSIV